MTAPERLLTEGAVIVRMERSIRQCSRINGLIENCGHCLTLRDAIAALRACQTVERELRELLAEAKSAITDNGRTHWDGCEGDPKH